MYVETSVSARTHTNHAYTHRESNVTHPIETSLMCRIVIVKTQRNVLLPHADSEKATSLTRLVEPSFAVEAVIYADLLWRRRPATCNMVLKHNMFLI